MSEIDVVEPMAAPAKQRRFLLVRGVDDSGVSGTGVVAEGVEFTDGGVAIRWIAADNPSSTAVWASIADAERIHGHGGHTRVVWLDA